MNRSLSRQAIIDGLFEKSDLLVHVYDIQTKSIVFTGNRREVSKFLGCPVPHVKQYIKTKARFKKKSRIKRRKS